MTGRGGEATTFPVSPFVRRLGWRMRQTHSQVPVYPGQRLRGAKSGRSHRSANLPPSRPPGLPRPHNNNFSPIPKRSEEHTSELQSRENLVCRLLLEKKKDTSNEQTTPI